MLFHKCTMYAVANGERRAYISLIAARCGITGRQMIGKYAVIRTCAGVHVGVVRSFIRKRQTLGARRIGRGGRIYLSEISQKACPRVAPVHAGPRNRGRKPSRSFPWQRKRILRACCWPELMSPATACLRRRLGYATAPAGATAGMAKWLRPAPGRAAVTGDGSGE